MNKDYQLGNLCSVGSSKRIHLSDYVEKGVPFYRSKEIIELSKGNNISDTLYISNEKYNEIKEKFPVPQENDILITSVGTIGISYLVKNANFYFKDGNLTWLRNINSNIVEVKFLIKWLKSDFFLTQIYNNNIGAVQKAITIDYLKQVKISLPDLLTQQKIASVLSVLDDKIELNNSINIELEQIAKTLYDYWFVQFDFPNEEGKPYKSSGGKMVYNEVLKRKIPKGWNVTVFNEWIEKTKTGDWGKDRIEGNYIERVYCVRGADINGLNGKGDIKAPERFILKNNLSKKLQPNDFIVEISGGSPTQSTARIALLTKESFERFDTSIICSNFCKAITLKDEAYVYNFQQEWQRLYNAGVFFGYEGKTSGIKNFQFDSFMDSYHVVKPDEKLVKKFNVFATDLEKKRQSNLKQNQELSSLRDWLLPMLMNGQVKIAD